MTKLIQFLTWLEEHDIHFRLSKIRDSILVEAAVPGERWEIEFFANGEILIEKFRSTGQIQTETDLEAILSEFVPYQD